MPERMPDQNARSECQKVCQTRMLDRNVKVCSRYLYQYVYIYLSIYVYIYIYNINK